MSTSLSRSFRRPVSIATVAALALGGSLLSTATAYANTEIPPDFTGYEDGQYVVVLNGDSAATYQGGLPNLPATAPVGTQSLDAQDSDVIAYTDHIVNEQVDVADDAGVTAHANLALTLNGFTASLTGEQARDLATDYRVSGVYELGMYQVDGSPANEFLDLDTLHAAVGGDADAGAGVVVGVIDTGIAPENPLFAGAPLGTTPGAEPYLDGDTITFERSDGGTFTGLCQPGTQFTADMCSTKIVGARYYLDGFGENRIGPVDIGEYPSPRDGAGHGSHTASTAAGNHNVPITSAGGSDLGTMSGVAPAARISVYKACWSGPDPAVRTDDGCAGLDLLAAIEQATADGVDVINYSIGGGSDTTNVDPVDLAFFGAAAAGVFISASAGNSGPGASTLDHGEPWLTSVANTTIANYEGTITLPDGTALPGGSVTLPIDGTPVTGTLVYAGDVAAAGAVPANAQRCFPGTLDPAQVAGMIVLCDRGENARVEKGDVVAQAGGIGMVLTNVAAGESIDLDDQQVPTLQTDAAYREAIAAVATARGTVSLTVGNTSGIETNAPVVAGSSSRGPVETGGMDIVKPDVAAPGTGIIAAGANAQGAAPAFVFMSGTSMAAPHVAGLAAIYLSEHPHATPAEIKSALMTTATDTLNADGTPNQDWFAQGAGFVNTSSFLNAGLYYANNENDWWAYLRGQGYTSDGSAEASPIDASNLNLASIGIGSLTGPETITRTLTALQPGQYTVAFDAPTGIGVEVSPSTLDFTTAGQSLSYEVTITPTNNAAPDTWAMGSLTWSDSVHNVRSPIAVYPQAVAAPNWIEGQNTSNSIPVEITAGRNGEIAMTGNGLVPMTNIEATSGVPTDQTVQIVEVPEGLLGLYVSLSSADQAADLDLELFRLDATGSVAETWQSATAAADEAIVLDNPTPGVYATRVTVFSTPNNGEVAYSLDQAQVAPGAGSGQFSTSPASVTGATAQTSTFDLDWQGLELGQEYVGIVTYSTSEQVRTWVHVTSGAIGMPEPDRLEGADRYETAIAASQHGWADGAATVYIASGQNYPDGLSAGPAAAHENAPLLLTTQANLPASTLDEIERLAPTNIVIVGGEPSVSAAVETALSDTGATVTRIAGEDRFETSRLVATHAFGESGATRAFIATGRNFPDALAAGAAGGAIDAPVILVNGEATSLDEATASTLTALGVTRTYVAGGAPSVSNGIVAGLTNGGYFPQRLAGADRFETSALIAQTIFPGPVNSMYVASGMNFPDALAASALAGMQGAPLYVTQSGCVPSSIIADSLRLGQPDVYIMGSAASLSDGVATYQTCA